MRQLTAVIMILLMSWNPFDSRASELETAGPAVTELFTEAGHKYFDMVMSLDDKKLDDYIVQFGTEGKTAEREGLITWKEIRKYLGGFQAYEDTAVYALENGNYVISVISLFENGEAILTLTIDSDLQTVKAVNFQKVKQTNRGNPGIWIAEAVIAVAATIVVWLQKNENI